MVGDEHRASVVRDVFHPADLDPPILAVEKLEEGADPLRVHRVEPEGVDDVGAMLHSPGRQPASVGPRVEQLGDRLACGLHDAGSCPLEHLRLELSQLGQHPGRSRPIGRDPGDPWPRIGGGVEVGERSLELCGRHRRATRGGAVDKPTRGDRHRRWPSMVALVAHRAGPSLWVIDSLPVPAKSVIVCRMS